MLHFPFNQPTQPTELLLFFIWILSARKPQNKNELFKIERRRNRKGFSIKTKLKFWPLKAEFRHFHLKIEVVILKLIC